METEELEKKIKVGELLEESWAYFVKNMRQMMAFSGMNLLIGILAVYGIDRGKSAGSWLLLVLWYLFFCFFFRFYFDKKPYLSWRPIARSLVPSVKIVFFVVVLALILAMLPLVLPFIGVASSGMADDYVAFLQRYMQDIPLVDVGLNLVLVFIMPVIFYRPFLAWIAAAIGRKGSIKIAFKKTQGNYWSFVLLGLVMIVPLGFLYHIAKIGTIVEVLGIAIAAPLLIYFNLVAAKIYEIFYED